MADKLGIKKWDPADFLETDEEIGYFLEEAFATGEPEEVAYALGVVARAKGLASIARETGISREGLSRALSETGNPELATIMKVANACGIRFSATIERPAPTRPVRKSTGQAKPKDTPARRKKVTV